jgi:P27 family predicted phage terminase small subunit
MRNPTGRKPKNQKEPLPKGNLSAAPAHFDAELTEVWDYAIRHAPAGLLKMLDSGVLETWCTAHVLHRKAVAEVRKFGMLVKPPNSPVPVQSPWLPIVNKQAFIMLRAVDHLGFSPASRTRIMLDDQTPSALARWDDVETG